MLRNVFLKTLRDRRRSLIGWSLGFVAFTGLVMAVYPTIEQSADDFRRLLETLPPAVKALSGRQGDLTTPAGYLDGQLFNLMVPLLLLTFAIGFGSRTIAGEEQNRTLELVLATPIARWRVAADKLAAMTVSLLVLGTVVWTAVALVGPPVGLDVPPGRLAQAALGAVLLALVFGTLALAVGCLTGRQAVASAVATAFAVATYMIDAFAPLVDAMDRLKGLSPFYYYDASEPLRQGLDPGHAAALVVLSIAFASVALVSFDRRDVAV